jgi:hypothetical protein
MDSYAFAKSSLARGLDALTPSDVLLSDVRMLHSTRTSFFARFLSRGSTAERIRLCASSESCACHGSIKQLDGFSEASCQELCDTDLASTLEPPGQLPSSCATGTDASTLEPLSQSPLPSVDEGTTSLSPRASSVIANEGATPIPSLWSSTRSSIVELRTDHSLSGLSSINSSNTTISSSSFSQAAAQFYYNALPLKHHKRVPDLVFASGFVGNSDLRWLKNVNVWSTTMKLPGVKEDQSSIQRLYQTYDSLWKLDKHLKCAVRLCSLFLSQSVEDTLATVPDDISGQYRMKATYERMASEVDIPLERMKRDVTLSRQYMFP